MDHTTAASRNPTRHIFIVNELAGKKKSTQKFFAKIRTLAAQNPLVEYLPTKQAGDATRLARTEAEKGDPVRLYFVGGDGTLFEGLNGIVGFDNVEIGCVPCGTGNDYIKEYPEGKFHDLHAQIEGTARTVDIIRIGEKYAINLCSVGMDAEVAAQMDIFKRWPLLKGRGAYVLSLLYCFFSKIRFPLKIIIDDAETIEGTFLFAVAANARYYGGGFLPAPTAKPDDGHLDFVMVNAVSRARILRLLNRYKEGTALEVPGLGIQRTGKKMTLSSKVQFAVNMDGECFYANEASFEIVPQAVKFIVP